MSLKPSFDANDRSMLATLIMAGGFLLQIFSARHPLWHDIGIAVIFAGFVLHSFGSYFFVPAVLVLVGCLLGFGPKAWGTPSVAVMALGIVVGIYGWWKHKKSQAAVEDVA